MLQKLKNERELSKEIVSTVRMSVTGGYDPSQSMKKSLSSTSSSVKYKFISIVFINLIYNNALIVTLEKSRSIFFDRKKLI